MDPDATYQDMTAAYDAEDYGQARDSARHLINWMRRGGFPPSELTRAEARTVAELIRGDSNARLREAREARRHHRRQAR